MKYYLLIQYRCSLRNVTHHRTETTFFFRLMLWVVCLKRNSSNTSSKLRQKYLQIIANQISRSCSYYFFNFLTSWLNFKLLKYQKSTENFLNSWKWKNINAITFSRRKSNHLSINKFLIPKTNHPSTSKFKTIHTFV